MNLRTVKNAGELKLNGVTFDCEWRDKVLSAVTLTDKSGNLVRFVLENYAVRTLVPAAPEKRTVHVVSGKVRAVGTDIREEFDDAYAANSRRSELEQADVCEVIAVGVEDVEIPF